MGDDLATQISEARPDRQEEKLYAAAVYVKGLHCEANNDWYSVFDALLAIGTDEAFTGAAMMLVPEGLMPTVSVHDDHSAASLFTRDEDGERVTACPLSVAATPALAIASAAVRAKEKE